MGFKLTLNGNTYEPTDFSVQEDSTPLAAGDSSGQVGTITFSIPQPDPDVQPNHPINIYGPNILVDQAVRLADTRKGFTLGTVTKVQKNRRSGLIQVTARSRLGDLNVFNVQADPFVGSLDDAFEYYLSLANITTDFFVDPVIATTPVVFPGWSGELWYNLKQMTAALDCDISLVSGIILLRRIRARTATRGRDLERLFDVGGGTLAQFIEVYQYNNRPITNELVYPPGGWSEDVTTINVNAGETITEDLELSASVVSIQQPTMQTFVSRHHNSSSVFTVVGDDGLPIDPTAWADHGGSLTVTINPDTTSLSVRITAPTGLPNKNGQEIGVYGISLSSDDSTGRYSTLRILGTGVAFNKQSRLVPTGITPSESATEIGVTIDNPFLSTSDEVNRAGARAVRAYNGSAMGISGTVVAINRLGDDGALTLRTYDFVQNLYSGLTYGDVQTLLSGKTYLEVQNELNAGLENEFENQVFGNVAGARIWDETSKRWYRIRSATPVAASISFTAEDDLIHSDIEGFYTGLTYDDVQNMNAGLTYRQVDLKGMR